MEQQNPSASPAARMKPRPRRTADEAWNEEPAVDEASLLRALLDHAPHAILVYDADQERFTTANPQALDLLGLDQDSLARVPPLNLAPPRQPDGRDSAEVARRHVQRALGGETHVFEWRQLDAEGRSVDCEVRLAPLPLPGRRLLRVDLHDISDRKRTERERDQARAQFERIVEHLPDCFWSSEITGDGTLRVRYVSPGWKRIWGWEPEDIYRDPRLWIKAIVAEDREAAEWVFEEVCDEKTTKTTLYRIQTRGGEIRWVEDTMSAIVDEAGELIAVDGIARDVTEQRQAAEQLQYRAAHDSLTGLLNRGELERRLARVLPRAQMDGSRHALCYLDLDQFKVINDTWGHGVGDELLRQLATLLDQQMAEGQTLARLGGDEFGVLLEDCTMEQARRVAEKLRKLIETFRFRWHDQVFAIGVSIGVAPIDGFSLGVDTVLSAADSACYAAKDQGRNAIHLYDAGEETMARAQLEMQWVARIQQALEEGRLRLWAQPLLSLRPENRPGRRYELLLRLIDEEGGVEPADSFLAAAERYSLSTRLDRWVVREACRWIAGPGAAIPDLIACGINLSGLSLGNEAFLEFVIEELQRTGTPASKICFEITETAAIANLEKARRFITRLKELGCVFSLDDFGSGFSSFGYLKCLPVDSLKIDGVFVREILTDPFDLAVVETIHEISHRLGKKTVAEWVESVEVLEKLEEIGVDFAQGWAISPPRPLEEIAGGAGVAV